MKEKYIKPVFELESFNLTNVITTSGTNNNGDGPIQLPDIDF